MSFDQDFARLVTPRLAAACRHWGWMIAADSATWSDATGEVLDIARHYGALHLTPKTFDTLIDWIGTRLLREVDAAEPHIAAMQHRLDILELRDPVKYYDALAKGDARLRWAYSAISKPYREHLTRMARYAR